MNLETRETQSVTVHDLIIRDDFRDLLPPLTQSQIAEIAESVKAVGVNIPLVVWSDGDSWYLVDGHNRHREWAKSVIDNSSLPEPSILELVADSSEQVSAWIIKSHVNRRNLTDAQQTELMGRVYNSSKKPEGRPSKKLGQNDPVSEGGTAEKVAQDFGVSEKSVKRAGDFAKGMEVLDEENPGAAEAIRTGKVTVNKADVEKIGRAGTTKKTDEPPKPKTDPSKRPIPANMEEIFACCADFNSLMSKAAELKKAIHEVCDKDGFAHFRLQQADAAIANLVAELKFAKPHTTCVKAIHKGSDCPLCRGTGFLVRDTMGRLSDLDKAKLPEVI